MKNASRSLEEKVEMILALVASDYPAWWEPLWRVQYLDQEEDSATRSISFVELQRERGVVLAHRYHGIKFLC